MRRAHADFRRCARFALRTLRKAVCDEAHPHLRCFHSLCHSRPRRPMRRRLRQLPRHLPARGGRAGRSGARARHARRPHVRSEGDLARSPAGRVSPELRAVRHPPHRRAARQGPAHDADARDDVAARRAAVRRARLDRHRYLGPGDRFRRRHRQVAGHPLTRDARARLPAQRHVPGRAHGRAADHGAGRSFARRDARRLGGRKIARRSSCRPTTSSSRSTSTATAGAT